MDPLYFREDESKGCEEMNQNSKPHWTELNNHPARVPVDRTWLTKDMGALGKNVAAVKRLIGSQVKLVAVMIGEQNGKAITLNDIAMRANTVPAEFMLGIDRRVRRVTINQGDSEQVPISQLLGMTEDVHMSLVPEFAKVVLKSAN